jgi:hypothetical protein
LTLQTERVTSGIRKDGRILEAIRKPRNMEGGAPSPPFGTSGAAQAHFDRLLQDRPAPLPDHAGAPGVMRRRGHGNS